jgi:7,8-dihydroneopterin aldolase/epimerase/oxygenase
MDNLSINQLKVLTTIGIYSWEQAIRQPLLLDLQLGCDLRPAALEDNLQLSINYEAVAASVTSYLQQNCFLLIERVAERVAEQLLQQFPLDWIKITVTKPGALADALSVGVTIERHSRS